MKPYRKRRNVVALILKFGSRRRWVFHFTLRQLNAKKGPNTHSVGCCVSSRCGLDPVEEGKVPCLCIEWSCESRFCTLQQPLILLQRHLSYSNGRKLERRQIASRLQAGHSTTETCWVCLRVHPLYLVMGRGLWRQERAVMGGIFSELSWLRRYRGFAFLSFW